MVSLQKIAAILEVEAEVLSVRNQVMRIPG